VTLIQLALICWGDSVDMGLLEADAPPECSVPVSRFTRHVAASLDREVPLDSAEESTRGQDLCAAWRELVAVRLRMISDVQS
jgi:hypothetical protein